MSFPKGKFAINRKSLIPEAEYGRLTVISDDKPGFNALFRCVCGNVCEKSRSAVKNGLISSCGCLHRAHAEEVGHARAKAPGYAEFVVHFGTYFRRAKRRGIQFVLTAEEFLSITQEPCHYCGVLPQKGKVFQHHGIDRYDSSKGYTPENCVSCCEICNRAKLDLPHHEFEDWLERITDEKPYRPQGWVAISKIVDGFGKEISYAQAVKYGWLTPRYNTPAVHHVDEQGKEVGSPNLFLDQGRQIVCFAAGFRSPIQNFTIQSFGVGTGLTPARVTDVALEAPITLSNSQTTKPVDSIDFISPFVLRVSFTLGGSDANGYIISEQGLFSGGGALMARKIRAVSINKTSDFSPTLTWRIRF